MKKRLLGVLLALALVLSLNVVVFAPPGSGIVNEPIIRHLPIECVEDYQAQDNDDQDQPLASY